MARRLFNGRAFSEDGWPYVDEGSCTWATIPGTAAHLQIQNGVPFAAMRAFAADYNAFVEPILDADCACFTQGNSVATSNHPGATAMDLRWILHPFQRRGTFSPAQLKTIQELLEFYKGIIFWAGVDWFKGGWGSPIDEMHWQMDYGTYDQRADRPSQFALDWVAKNVRADGYSTFRRGNAVVPPVQGDAVDVLMRATGITHDKAVAIMPTVIQGLRLSQCNNVNRIAMWLAQMGEESGSFVYTEEIAKNGRYAPYIGRTWIQITWDYNYRAFSQWLYGQGLISSPTYFVDHPAELAQQQWAGIGPAWYWTVQRPQINAMCDADNLYGVTQAINGGQNGAADRGNRYARAKALGDELLTLIATSGDEMSAQAERMIDEIHRELTQRLPSRSPLRYLDQKQHYPDGLVDTMAGFELNVDGMTHVQYCIELARYNHSGTMALLNEIAGADPARYPDRADDIKLAQAILNKVASDKVKAVLPSGVSGPSVVNATATVTPAQVQQIASAAASAVSAQQVTAAAPVQTSGTNGQLFGQALDSLEALKAVLSPQGKATIDALAKVVQETETGVSA